MFDDHAKSCTVTIEIPNRAFNLMQLLHGEPSREQQTLVAGSLYTGELYYRGDSTLLGSRRTSEVGVIPEMKLYFRYTDEGYEVYLLNDDPQHPTLRLGKNNQQILRATHEQLNDQTRFELFDTSNNLVALDALEGKHHRVKIKVIDGGFLGAMKFNGSRFSYIADVGTRNATTFNLNFLNR